LTHKLLLTNEDDDFIVIPNQDINTFRQTQNSVENFEDSRSLEIATDNIFDENNKSGNIDNTNAPEKKNKSGFTVQRPQTPETAGWNVIPEDAYPNPTLSQSELRKYSRPQRYCRPPETLQYGRLESPVSMPQYSVQNITCTPGTLYRNMGYQPVYSNMPYEHPLVFQLVA